MPWRDLYGHKELSFNHGGCRTSLRELLSWFDTINWMLFSVVAGKSTVVGLFSDEV
jgi:hypothetical protein